MSSDRQSITRRRGNRLRHPTPTWPSWRSPGRPSAVLSSRERESWSPSPVVRFTALMSWSRSSRRSADTPGLNPLAARHRPPAGTVAVEKTWQKPKPRFACHGRAPMNADDRRNVVGMTNANVWCRRGGRIVSDASTPREPVPDQETPTRTGFQTPGGRSERPRPRPSADDMLRGWRSPSRSTRRPPITSRPFSGSCPRSTCSPSSGSTTRRTA